MYCLFCTDRFGPMFRSCLHASCRRQNKRMKQTVRVVKYIFRHGVLLIRDHVNFYDRSEKSMIKYLIVLIIGSFFFSTAAASDKFVCSTSKHTVIITLLPSGKYQYRAWNKPKSITGKPDVLIVGGEEITEGTCVCRYTRWRLPAPMSSML